MEVCSQLYGLSDAVSGSDSANITTAGERVRMGSIITNINPLCTLKQTTVGREHVCFNYHQSQRVQTAEPDTSRSWKYHSKQLQTNRNVDTRPAPFTHAVGEQPQTHRLHYTRAFAGVCTHAHNS